MVIDNITVPHTVIKDKDYILDHDLYHGLRIFNLLRPWLILKNGAFKQDEGGWCGLIQFVCSVFNSVVP